MSGGGTKVPPRCVARNLRVLKAQEGIEARADVKPLSASTDRCPEKSSEDPTSGSGAGGATRLQRRTREKVKRAAAGAQASAAGHRGKPL